MSTRNKLLRILDEGRSARDFIVSYNDGHGGVGLLRYRWENPDDYPIVYATSMRRAGWHRIGAIAVEEFIRAFTRAIPASEAKAHEFDLPFLAPFE